MFHASLVPGEPVAFAAAAAPTAASPTAAAATFAEDGPFQPRKRIAWRFQVYWPEAGTRGGAVGDQLLSELDAAQTPDEEAALSRHRFLARGADTASAAVWRQTPAATAAVGQ